MGKLIMGKLIGVVVVLWLVVGAIAAGQRGYYTNDKKSDCAHASDTALTIVAGPLNYVGANPKVTCKVPQPSK
jgi:hypothetical protein